MARWGWIILWLTNLHIFIWPSFARKTTTPNLGISIQPWVNRWQHILHRARLSACPAAWQAWPNFISRGCVLGCVCDVWLHAFYLKNSGIKWWYSHVLTTRIHQACKKFPCGRLAIDSFGHLHLLTLRCVCLPPPYLCSKVLIVAMKFNNITVLGWDVLKD